MNGPPTNPLEAHLSRQIEHSRDFFWHRLRWHVVRQYLPRSRGFDLVDVGAGVGVLGEFLARYFPLATYRFVEPIEFLERRLEARYGTEANAKGLDMYGADYVALLDVLEHQPDDRRFLSELADRLEPGTLLLVTVPALSSLWSDWDVALGHYRRYDKRTLLHCLQGLPVQVCEMNYLFPEMVPFGLLRRYRRPAEEGAKEPGRAEFPELPSVVNKALYTLGLASLRLRNRWRVGTSLLVVLRRA